MPVEFGHHVLHNRYRIEGTMILGTPLRISSGRAAPDTDAPFMRDHSGKPYIPGSSLRGAIRSAVERILTSVSKSVSGLRSCVLFSSESDGCSNKVDLHRMKMEERKTHTDPQDNDNEWAQFAKDELCDVCKLFGSTVFASRLVVEDAYPPRGVDASSHSRIRDSVAIDRDTGTAHRGAKFDYEVLEPNPTLKFTLKLQAENVTDKDLLLLKLIVGLLKQGLFVGGKSAAGLGMIKLDGDPTVTGFTNATTLWDALLKGEDPHHGPLTLDQVLPC